MLTFELAHCARYLCHNEYVEPGLLERVCAEAEAEAATDPKYRNKRSREKLLNKLVGEKLRLTIVEFANDGFRTDPGDVDAFEEMKAGPFGADSETYRDLSPGNFVALLALRALGRVRFDQVGEWVRDHVAKSLATV